MSPGRSVKWGVDIRAHWTYKSPRGLCQRFLHLVLDNRACKRTLGVYLAADEPSHVPTIALALLTSVVNLDVPLGHVLGPRNKPPRAERLMTSAALTCRTTVELGLPALSGDLLESLL
jgi:hypothetical protein